MKKNVYSRKNVENGIITGINIKQEEEGRPATGWIIWLRPSKRPNNIAQANTTNVRLPALVMFDTTRRDGKEGIKKPPIG